MECPRCRLMNPDSAMRCDCGYDFQSGTVKTPYHDEPIRIPVWIPCVLIIGSIVNLLAMIGRSAENGDKDGLATGLLVLLIWSCVVFFVYLQLTKGKKWARIALALLSLPIGISFLFSERLKAFIRQQNDKLLDRS